MTCTVFKNELEFEPALVKQLEHQGWKKYGSGYLSKENLITHWKDIISQRNSTVLKNNPLTDEEMKQVIRQINDCKTALDIHALLLGKSVYITRDNQQIRLNIFNPYANEDSTIFEVIEQPELNTDRKILHSERRGDIELLINGMPLVHIELKNEISNAINEAEDQIHTYLNTGMFDNGYFSLVQLFVVMSPQETRYFAKPNKDEIDKPEYSPVFHFHWAYNNNDIDPQKNNRPINDGGSNQGEYISIAQTLLSPDVIFKLVGLYMIADKSDRTLKVLRSYQYYAVEKILHTLQDHCWDNRDPQNQLGGFIWHTTGSGKTMTSFKVASLISQAEYTRQDSTNKRVKYSYADKVIFLMDRIELGDQSLSAFQNFVDGLTPEEAKSKVSGVKSTQDLAKKIVQDDPRIIVTSIQKMSNINTKYTDPSTSNDSDDLDKPHSISLSNQKTLDQKRIVFIIDECHRSTFGTMLGHIKNAFPRAVFFGFTGTPIKEVNQKNKNTTTSLFGNELHRYTITDGLRDRNVLGFDPYYFKPDDKLKEYIALKEVGFESEKDYRDKASLQEMNRFHEIMALDWPEESIGDDGKKHNGIEHYLKKNHYYEQPLYREKVVQDIYDTFKQYNCDEINKRRYSAIFATSSIPEAIEYYYLFKEKVDKNDAGSETDDLSTVAVLFDPSENWSNSEKDRGKSTTDKRDAVESILKHYGTTFFNDEDYFINLKDPFDGMKADISARLAHKNNYADSSENKPLDLLIVVDQMLTGFDSKWIRTLYLDKIMTYEGLIQAFSRTNRVFDGKKHGIIKCYREPYTMEKNVEEAFALYAGGDQKMIFVPRLEENYQHMRDCYERIEPLLNRKSDGSIDWNHLPSSPERCEVFAEEFTQLQSYYQAAQPQGFKWNDCEKVAGFNQKQYTALTQRYRDFRNNQNRETQTDGSHSYDASGIDYITTKGNSINYKYLEDLIIQQRTKREDQQDLQREFDDALAQLPEYIQEAIKEISEHYDSYTGITLKEKLSEYFQKQTNKLLDNIVRELGCDKALLKTCLDYGLTKETIDNELIFDELVTSCELSTLKEYRKKCGWNRGLPTTLARQLLKHYILHPDFDINDIEGVKQILNNKD